MKNEDRRDEGAAMRVMVRSIVVFALLPLALTSTATAQGWTGPAGVGVEVRDEAGQPIQGAAVVLVPGSAASEDAPPFVFTGRDGRIEIKNLAEGEWQVEVRAAGYMIFNGYLRLTTAEAPEVGFSSRQRTGTFWQPLQVRFFVPGSPGDAVMVAATKEERRNEKKRIAEKEELERQEKKTKDRGELRDQRRARAATGDVAVLKEPPAPPPSETEPAEPPQVAEVVPPSPPPPRPQPVDPPPAREAGRRAPPPPSAPPEPVTPPPPPSAPPPPAVAPPPQPAPPPPTQPAPPSQSPPAAPSQPPAAQPPAPAPPQSPPPPPVEVVPPAAPPPPPRPAPRESSPSLPKPNVPPPPPPAPRVVPPPPAPPPAPPPPAPVAPPPPVFPPITAPAPQTAPPPAAPAEPRIADATRPADPTAPAATSDTSRPVPSIQSRPVLFTGGACPECKPGEWALILEKRAAPSAAGAAGSASCGANRDATVKRLSAEVLGPAGAAVAGFAGPVSDGYGNGLPAATAQSIPADLAPALATNAGSCQDFIGVLPQGARFIGFRFEAEDASGKGDCFGEDPCAIGQARWSNNPRIERTATVTLVHASFSNESTSVERRGRMTLYFQPPRGWRPPTP